MDPRQQHRGVRPGDVFQRRLGASRRDQAARIESRRCRYCSHVGEQELVPRGKKCDQPCSFLLEEDPGLASSILGVIGFVFLTQQTLIK